MAARQPAAEGFLDGLVGEIEIVIELDREEPRALVRLEPTDEDCPLTPVRTRVLEPASVDGVVDITAASVLVARWRALR